MRHLIAARVAGTLLSVLALLSLRPPVAQGDALAPAVLQPLAPVSYQRLAPQADPRGGSPVYLTKQDIVVTARVQAVYQLVALITGGGTLDYARVSARPDASGRVTIPLHLPDTGVIYVIQAYATIGRSDHWDLTAGSFRAMAPRPIVPAGAPTTGGWAQVRREVPAAIPVYHPTWLPARFAGPVSVDVPDANVSGGPAYRVGYRSASGNVLIFALGAVNSGPPATTAPLNVAGVTGQFVIIQSGWWPQMAVLWQEGAWEGKPLAYIVQAMGVSHDELLQVAASLTAVPSGSAGILPQAGEGGLANGTIPGVPLLLLLAGSTLLTGWLGRSGNAAPGWRR